jgi:hypothetical protein
MVPPGQKPNVRDSEHTASQPSSSSSGEINAGDTPTDKSSGLGRTRSLQKSDATSSTSRATGPRTPEGKRRMKHNAVKHGIFSKVALLKNESQLEFDRLLNGLRADLQPEGMLEQTLVEKLAMTLWRHRRLYIAEVAEIENGVAFLIWDESESQRKDAQQASNINLLNFAAELVGLTTKMENPWVLDRCLELLEELRNDIKTTGLNSSSDEEILVKLYGNRSSSMETLLDTYRRWNDTAACSDEERAQNGYATVEKCTSNVLDAVKVEITHLTGYKKEKTLVESERVRLESLRKSVPDSPQLDRLLKYETNLARDFDRTLTQLERIQRMRKGQSVLPPIKVDVSS